MPSQSRDAAQIRSNHRILVPLMSANSRTVPPWVCVSKYVKAVGDGLLGRLERIRSFEFERGAPPHRPVGRAGFVAHVAATRSCTNRPRWRRTIRSKIALAQASTSKVHCGPVALTNLASAVTSVAPRISARATYAPS